MGEEVGEVRPFLEKKQKIYTIQILKQIRIPLVLEILKNIRDRKIILPGGGGGGGGGPPIPGNDGGGGGGGGCDGMAEFPGCPDGGLINLDKS